MMTKKRTAQEAGLPDDDRSYSAAAAAAQQPSASCGVFWGEIETMLAETYERNFERLEVLR